MKKIFSVALFATALTLVGALAQADTVAPAKYTPEQQACISSSRLTLQASTKSAQETFNAATKDALATKQSAIKAAQDAFNEATKDALATKQAAVKTAQAIKNPGNKLNAVLAANDEYNTSSAVKTAKPILTDAIKAANDAFNNNPAVASAKTARDSAIKSARDANIKKCTQTSTFDVSNLGASLLQAIINIFHFKK